MHLTYDLEKAIPENFDAHIRHIYSIYNNISISFLIAKRQFTFATINDSVTYSYKSPENNDPEENKEFHKQLSNICPDYICTSDDLIYFARKVANFMLNFDFYKGFI